MSSQVKRGGKVWKAVVGVISTVIIVGLFVALLVLTASGRWVDSVSSDSASVSHAVSQRRITAYCPSRMTLPDASAYGDSEYQPSEGDISSSAGFAAFGAVYRSQFGAFGGSGDTTQLKDLDPTDTAKVIAASADVDRTSLLFDTQLLESAAGVGASASVASWATKGDLRGLSATFCDVGALEQSFVLPDTQTGTTQQLVVANSSSKATVVDVRVWGTEQSGALALSTGSTLTVAANAESVLSLSAAASGQKGLYVTVSSRQTPGIGIGARDQDRRAEPKGIGLRRRGRGGVQGARLPGRRGGRQGDTHRIRGRFGVAHRRMGRRGRAVRPSVFGRPRHHHRSGRCSQRRVGAEDHGGYEGDGRCDRQP